MRYNNYHKHDHYGNPWSLDVVVKSEEYCKRAIELGHTTVFTTNHGVQGNIFDWMDSSKKYGLKMCYGTEAYYVPNRFPDAEGNKDRSNKHIIIIAKNNDGVMQLNDVMTEAHSSGFYYRPRIDKELLFSLNPNNFVITSACVAGIWDDHELLLALHRQFKNNFFLEIQAHNMDIQKKVNSNLLQFSIESGIPLIHANDSHYIYPEDSKYRDIFLKGKERFYENEEGMILDYPDSDEIFKRYAKQGILTKSQVAEALGNTLIFDDCENITLINDNIKLPPVSDNPTKELRDIVNSRWIKERDLIPPEKRKKYLDSIRYEMDIIEKTHMEDYFLIDYKVVKNGQEKYGGRLTNTGRGCFTGDSLIHTKNGIKELKNVAAGDEVISKDGKFHKVLNTMKYDIDEEMVEISHLYGRVKNHNPICTKDHKIYILRDGKLMWVEAQNLTSKDKVCVPKIEFDCLNQSIIDLNDYNIFGFRYDNEYIYEEYERSNSRYNKKINRYIQLDENFNTFIGLMYGDGFTNYTKQNEIGLAINTSNHKNTVNRMFFEIVANKIGVSIYEHKAKNKKLTQLFIRSKVFTNFIKTELFSSKIGCEKIFNSKWYYQSKNNLSALLKGLMLSDGSNKEHRISFDNISNSLINAYKIISLATNNGVNSISIRNGRIDNRGYKIKRSYQLRYNPNSNNAKKASERTIEDSYFYYLPIKSIKIIPKSKVTVYDLEIQDEHNYLINNMIVHNSAPSFYITKMLGLTDIDRISSPITLFPTRFMSVERILGARSLPDIDLNTADREPFIKATKDLLGEENCAWMLAWKPLQDASAFRVYCKGIGKNISEYDDIAKNLDDYRDDPKWKNIIEESKRFIGVVESISESPCSMLLYNKPVRKELGLVRTSKDKMCCLLDGYNCDKYKYLKNDYLTVTVWAIIRDVCNLAKIPIPTIRELDNLLDEKTFKIYEDGLTSTINQADSDFATGMVTTYKPKSVSEMSAFVAIIRPGCASLLQDFVNRQPYTTGVKELDDLLVEGNHRMIYQELIMKYLIWLGIPETGSYDIIKKIAKKKFKEAELAALKEKLLKGWIDRVGKQDGFIETWTVVEQAAKYSFNASHSLSYAYDSLYGAYLKSHYPLEYYTVALNYYVGDSDRTLNLTNELSAFNIQLKPIKFRYSKSDYSPSKEDNSIYKGIQSIKYMNSTVADEIYALRDNQYRTFIDLLYDLKEKTTINSRQLKILIELDFFEEFGDANYLLKLSDLVDELYGKVQLKKDKIESLNIDINIVRSLAEKETDKMFTKVNSKKLLNELSKQVTAKKRTLKEQINSQVEHLGYIDIVDERYSRMLAVISVDTKYSPRLKMYSLKNGTLIDCKVDKRTFNRNKLDKCDIIRVVKQNKKPKSKRLEDGTYEPIPGTSEIWLTDYEKVENI